MSRFQETVQSSIEAIGRLTSLEPTFNAAVSLLCGCLRDGGKVLVCGNGGSAADAAHFATELLCRFENDRPSLAGICLAADASFLSATANDYGFEHVFARQIEGLGKKGDALVAMSTSGNSANIVAALGAARTKGLRTLALLGRNGGKSAALADVELLVPATSTARIQEAQQVLVHALCDAIERELFGESRDSHTFRPEPDTNPNPLP